MSEVEQPLPSQPEPHAEPPAASDATTHSAGEEGAAVDAPGPPARAPKVDVIIGEIPDAHNLSKLLWTARCTDPAHDLLGQFATREEAEQAKVDHLRDQH